MNVPYRESALFFDCEDAALLGVIASPASPAKIGVVIIVGGPQYRVGSHRQFVTLARAMAQAGYACLRFDYHGMGDSDGPAKAFDAIDGDIAAGIDALCRETGVEKIVLWGLCDGASAAMMYAWTDPRVVGVVGVNPWVRTEDAEASARLRHYYLQRVTSRAFWRKLLTGHVDVVGSARGLARDARASASGAESRPRHHFLQRMHDGWQRFKHQSLFVLSGNDLTAREFEGWVASDPARRRLAARSDFRRVNDADHTFSRDERRRQLETLTIEWIQGLLANPSTA